MIHIHRAISLFCGLCFGALPIFAQEGSHPLPAMHAKSGVHCYNCHQEEKPTKKAVASESCMVCHGDYPAMRAATKDVKPNPHDSHLGEIPCTECHRQHLAPKVKCLECHEGKFKFNIK